MEKIVLAEVIHSVKTVLYMQRMFMQIIRKK